MRVSRHTKAADPPESGFREPKTSEPALPWIASAARSDINSTIRERPRGIARVPTHTVGRARERRAYVRARLALPLRVRRVAGQRDAKPAPLRTVDISSSGLYFLSPRRIEPGTPIEIEVLLVDHPFSRGTVRMHTEAHIVRAENATKSGWHGLAAIFDDIRFLREEPLPERYRTD